MAEIKPDVYTFAEVSRAASKHGIRLRSYLFDGGETVEVTTAHGDQMARITSLWGDPSATDKAAKWLMENTPVSVFDFAEG
jgi:hypothetical protein